MTYDTTKKERMEYLGQKPGIRLIKAGTPAMKELNTLLSLPDLNSQIVDIPVTTKTEGLTVGRFAMQPSADFLFHYTYLEVKVITEGSIIVRDEEGNRYEGHAGDIFIFPPGTKVIFDGESNGSAVYFAHRLPEPAFMKNA